QGANIKKAMELFSDVPSSDDNRTKASWLPCAAHVMQLCVNKSISSTPAVDAVLTKCQSISVHFRTFSSAEVLFEVEQKLLGMKPLKFLSVVITRWNSKLDMARRVLELIQPFKNFMERAELHEDKSVRKHHKTLSPHMLSDPEVAILQEA
ncbi:hypothetical protein BGZ58_005938, partial [Dissophora ornata]